MYRYNLYHAYTSASGYLAFLAAAIAFAGAARTWGKVTLLSAGYVNGPALRADRRAQRYAAGDDFSAFFGRFRAANAGRAGMAKQGSLGGDGKVKKGYRSSPEDCETCKERKYQG